MRGKEACKKACEVSWGITPAYAGKSVPPWRHSYNSWDHPRVCGEKQIPEMHASRTRGSPPRMRGKEYLGGGRYQVNGITPAYAGKSDRTI